MPKIVNLFGWKFDLVWVTIIFAILFISAVIVILLMGFTADRSNATEQACKTTCQNFDLEYYSSENLFNRNSRCWCLDNESNLPVEMPLNAKK